MIMKSRLYIFWLVVLLFNVGCQKASSQAELPRPESAPVNNEKNLIATQSNSKYGLSLLFYQNSNEKFPFLLDVQIRVDKTGKSFDLYSLMLEKEAASDDAANFWSPDGEYMVLHGSRLSVIKSSELLKLLSKPEFDSDKFYQNPKNVDFIEILTDKQNPEFRLRFKKWENNASFVFGVSRVDFADRTKTNEEFAEFRYDFAAKKLYRRNLKSNQETSSKFAGITGRNKKGLIRGGAIENDLIQ